MMQIDGFAPEFARAIADTVRNSTGLSRRVAVFDADNTLWDADLGEAFLRWLIAGRLLPGLDYSTDIYAEYERRVAANRAEGYGWCVRLMAGLQEQQIETWAAQIAYAWPGYRPRMRQLVDYLSHQGFEAWIVSASNQWVVRTASTYLGIPPDRVLGIRTVVQDGLLTDRLVLPLTCNQGKVDNIESVIHEVPLLAFGDSMGDIEMLCHARQAMVVGRSGQMNPRLLEEAHKRRWPVQEM